MLPRPRSSACVPVLLSILTALPLVGCDEDCEFNDVDVAGNTANPDGVPYPAGPFGAQPRQGATPGDILPNFVFRGYRNGDTSGDPVTLSLADLYDPTGQRQLVVHLMAAAMWCPVCHDQTKAMVQAHSTLRGEGAAILQAVIMGPDRNVSPDRCDLVDWIEEQSAPFTVVLDVDARRLATVAPLTAVPFNALIDARTMEVLLAGEGAPVDYTAYVRSALEWVAANPR